MWSAEAKSPPRVRESVRSNSTPSIAPNSGPLLWSRSFRSPAHSRVVLNNRGGTSALLLMRSRTPPINMENSAGASSLSGFLEQITFRQPRSRESADTRQRGSDKSRTMRTGGSAEPASIQGFNDYQKGLQSLYPPVRSRPASKLRNNLQVSSSKPNCATKGAFVGTIVSLCRHQLASLVGASRAKERGPANSKPTEHIALGIKISVM